MPSLHWLLDQPSLGLRLLVGAATDRPLTWAHSVDVVDPTPWLSGGELVLTTGSQLGRSAHAHAEYVARLAAAGAAGIGFGLSPRVTAVPETVVRACGRHNLPLIEVPAPTTFIAITQAVGRRLSEERLDELQRVLAYQRDITRAAVRGGPRSLVNRLAREVGVDVVVLDEYGGLVASSTRRAETIERVRAEFARLGTTSRGGNVAVDTASGTLELQLVQGRSGVCGCLAVRYDDPPTAPDRLLLNQAAGLVTLQLDWPAELIDTYDEVGGTLLSMIVDSPDPPGSLARNLGHFGFEANDDLVVILAGRTHHLAALEKALSSCLAARRRPHVATRVEGGVAIAVLKSDAHVLLDAMDDAVRAARMDDVVFGVSGVVRRTTIRSGVAPARLAADAARRDGVRIQGFDALTLGSVVADEAVRSRVAVAASAVLAAIDGADDAQDSRLRDSLEAYLRHNGSWAPAARSIGVHRHTLMARMHRVEQLADVRLDDPEDRALLLLAIIGAQLSG